MNTTKLTEIRERIYDLQHATLHGPIPLKTTMQIVADAADLFMEVDRLRDIEESWNDAVKNGLIVE